MIPPVASPRLARLFEGFAPGEPERLMAAGFPRVLRRGEVLFREGEPAEALFVAESGRLKLTQLTPGGQEVIMRYLAPGDLFAAVALFEGSSYPVTAQATERTRVRAWPRAALRELTREHPRLEGNVLRIVSTHMRETLSRVRELATEPVPQRLARTLLRLAEQVGERDGDGLVRLERITQQEIAEVAGTTFYTVSRTLADWEQQGWVETGRQRLHLRNPARLREIADGREGPPPTAAGAPPGPRSG